MKYRRFPLVVFLITLIFVFACGSSNDLQVTVSAQNTKIAELSSGSQPAPTDGAMPNDSSTATPDLSSPGTASTGKVPISGALVALPVKYTVGEKNSARDGFRNVGLQLYIQNISPSLYSPTFETAALHAVLTDSNGFTQQCLASDIHKIPAGYFPPGFGVPYQLSCAMSNNAEVKGFALTSNGQEIASLSAPPDGNYNEMPSIAGLLQDSSIQEKTASVDNIVEIELLSAKFDPQHRWHSLPNPAWLISLKVKNLYGAEVNYDPLGGIVRNLQVISDSGISPAEPETNLPVILPGEEGTWDFAVIADPSPNSALVIVVKRASNDPAYTSESLYTILRLPQPQ